MKRLIDDLKLWFHPRDPLTFMTLFGACSAGLIAIVIGILVWVL